MSLNEYNKALLDINLAKTPNLFTVEFQELLQIFWETYRLNSWQFFPSLAFIFFACENVDFYTKQDFSASSFPQASLLTAKCSRGYSIYFSLWRVILNWLAATKRAWIQGPRNWGKKRWYINIFISENFRWGWQWAQVTQAGHVRDLNKSAGKPGGFAAMSKEWPWQAKCESCWLLVQRTS